MRLNARPTFYIGTQNEQKLWAEGVFPPVRIILLSLYSNEQ